MLKKECYHNNFEVCKITRQQIDTSKEDYCIVLDCRGDKVANVGFYKNEPLKEKMLGQTKEKLNNAKEFIQKFSENIQKQFGDKENNPIKKEEYIVE